MNTFASSPKGLVVAERTAPSSELIRWITFFDPTFWMMYFPLSTWSLYDNTVVMIIAVLGRIPA
jgi:hypothetical protein